MTIMRFRLWVRASLVVATLLFAVSPTLHWVVGAQDNSTCQPEAALARVSLGLNGAQSNGNSSWASISGDGQYLSFTSSASNLVADDTNSVEDIFVHNRLTCQTERVSVATNGVQGNSVSQESAISADGRYVAFSSFASTLVADDTNDKYDVFVHDRQTGETARVSVASDGSQADQDSRRPAISADGRYVAFYSFASNLVSGDTNGVSDVFVYDRQTGETARVSVASDGSQADAMSSWPTISADGRYVAFYSFASNLVSGDTNGVSDVFVHDRQTGETALVSVASDGSQANGPSLYPAISGDGRYIAFNSSSTNLTTDVSSVTCQSPVGSVPCPALDVRDRQTGSTRQIYSTLDPILTLQRPLIPAISGDGRYITFSVSAGGATGRYDIFVFDLITGTNRSLTGGQPDGTSSLPSISGDGRYVAFESGASNPVPDNTTLVQDIFVAALTPAPTLKVQYMVGYAAPINREIASYFKIFNTAPDSVPLAGITMRYWFTRESAQNLLLYCTYATVDCANVTGKFVTLDSPLGGADTYVEIGFTTAAGTLAGYNQFSEVDMVVGRSDTDNFDQSNDYSFDAAKTVSAEHTRVTLYLDGALIWGVEPSAAPASLSQPAPTFVPQPTITPTQP